MVIIFLMIYVACVSAELQQIETSSQLNNIIVHSSYNEIDNNNTLLCAHPKYPCFYFPCNIVNSRLSEAKLYKCAKGLIFDNKVQRCVWALPWQACKMDQKPDDLDQTARSKNVIKSVPSIVFNPKENAEETDDVSLTSEYEEDEVQSQINDKYAYIIVPIKMSQHRKVPGDLTKKKIDTQKNKKLKKNKNNTKNYQDIFRYKKICYVTNWSQYRPKPANFVPENIDPFLCTHIVYAFAYIDNLTLTLKTIEENDEEMYRRINDLKFKNPKLKTMLGIGGWNMESKEFSEMVKTREKREKFIKHAIKFLRYHGFDGIDLDWEFPGDRGGSPSDKPNFTLMIREFREAINDETSLDDNKETLIMSAAVAAGKKRIDQGYEVKEIVKDLDFINLMAFDFHGSWDSQTGLNAPLYGNENETKENLEYNQDWGVSYWIKNGCPPYKLILGLPAYGRTFRLKDKTKTGLASDTFNDGILGNYTKTAGFLSYYEICDLKKTSNNWTTVWLGQSKSPYMYKDNDWISYDDIKSFHLRTAYVVAKKLGGMFIWSIDMDDFSGKFCNSGSYPLIKNSMSLLMDFMPDYYSSNVNQAPKQTVKSNTKKKQQSESQSKTFYILKDDTINSLNMMTGTISSNYRSINSGQNDTSEKQNKIREELLTLLTQQPQKFLSFNLPDTFNCTGKRNGLHRDQFDCSKYYLCQNDNSIDNMIQTKAYNCPLDSVFNMNGCYCDRKQDTPEADCVYLEDTYCDFSRFKNMNKKFT